MGIKQSKVRISIPERTCCFPAYDSESELFETAKQIEDSHVQAVKLASLIGSVMGGPCTPIGQLAFTATTVLFTFLIHRMTANPSNKADSHGDKSKDKPQSNSRTTLENALIDSKVSAAIAKKSVCELQAKLCVINNRYQRLLSEISFNDRLLEVVPAIQTCEEVLQLFHDPSHVFRLNPLVSSPFIVAFSGIFVAIAELSVVLIPSYKGPLVGEMNLLSQTLALYKATCIQTRMESLKFRRIQPESMLDVVANGIPDINYRMEDACLQTGANQEVNENLRNSGSRSSISEDEIDNVYQNANEAVAAYKAELEGEYDRFFKTALETISKFSGFNNNIFSPCTVRCNIENVNNNSN